jgi:hypothetical protein
VVGDQQKRTRGDTERSDARAELLELPDLFGADDVAVVRAVLVECAGSDVEVSKLAERGSG